MAYQVQLGVLGVHSRAKGHVVCQVQLGVLDVHSRAVQVSGIEGGHVAYQVQFGVLGVHLRSMQVSGIERGPRGLPGPIWRARCKLKFSAGVCIPILHALLSGW